MQRLRRRKTVGRAVYRVVSLSALDLTAFLPAALGRRNVCVGSLSNVVSTKGAIATDILHCSVGVFISSGSNGPLQAATPRSTRLTMSVAFDGGHDWWVAQQLAQRDRIQFSVGACTGHRGPGGIAGHYGVPEDSAGLARASRPGCCRRRLSAAVLRNLHIPDPPSEAYCRAKSKAGKKGISI
jgi:hypothetical protein